MATILDKDLTRESTVKYNDREIQVTLTEDQKISFKLKGMKSGALTIGIEELYGQLFHGSPVASTGLVKTVVDDVVTKKGSENGSVDNPMISLYDLRSDINTTPMSMETKILFDTFVSNAIKAFKKPFLDKIANTKAQADIDRRAKIVK
jgi:hypothetical protein